MTNPQKIERSASGKVIVCGEHSVVYGRPAIAVPVSDLRAYAKAEPSKPGSQLRIVMPDLARQTAFQSAPEEDPLAKICHLVLAHLNQLEPDLVLTITSDLPIGAGMGSGAAVTVAAARALSAFLGEELPPEIISEMTYEVEKIHHGTPSGIDNTVISWEQPVYFVKDEPPETFEIQRPFHLIIANSGISGSTREAVTSVRQRWETSPDFYEILFDCIGSIADAARNAIATGDLKMLGALLNENHKLLQKLGVSLPELDQLVDAARGAGALGAKLTGAGQGGDIIALAPEDRISAVEAALREADAAQIWCTHVGPPGGKCE